jgi:glucan phosphoethanolaminetransferase (alkaline phosphatase superfamily)
MGSPAGQHKYQAHLAKLGFTEKIAVYNAQIFSVIALFIMTLLAIFASGEPYELSQTVLVLGWVAAGVLTLWALGAIIDRTETKPEYLSWEERKAVAVLSRGIRNDTNVVSYASDGETHVAVVYPNSRRMTYWPFGIPWKIDVISHRSYHPEKDIEQAVEHMAKLKERTQGHHSICQSNQQSAENLSRLLNKD